MEILMGIFWWLIALVILFVFFGGITSAILAWLTYLANVTYFAKKSPRPILIVGFLASGGVSYWLCHCAMGRVELSFFDTAIAIIISSVTFIVTISLLYGRREVSGG